MTTPRTVLVTGSSRGIGRAICQRLLRQGHVVLGAARDAEIPNVAGEYRPLSIDLSRMDQIDGSFKHFLNDQPPLDAVVSNAGSPAFGNLEELSSAQITDGLTRNLLSHMWVARTVLP